MCVRIYFDDLLGDESIKYLLYNEDSDQISIERLVSF